MHPRVRAYRRATRGQLVGQSCTICAERIGNELDARFCDACCCPVHHACSTAALGPESGTDVGCRACGVSRPTLDAIGDRCLREMEAEQRRQQGQAALTDTMRGVFLLVLGIIGTLACSGLMAGSGRIWIATGVLMTGVMLIVCGVLAARRN